VLASPALPIVDASSKKYAAAPASASVAANASTDANGGGGGGDGSGALTAAATSFSTNADAASSDPRRPSDMELLQQQKRTSCPWPRALPSLVYGDARLLEGGGGKSSRSLGTAPVCLVWSLLLCRAPLAGDGSGLLDANVQVNEPRVGRSVSLLLQL
jgi:hypothetical protein